MRKMRMTRRTSISGMKFISGSSRVRAARRFIVKASAAIAVHEVDEADRLLLHLDDQPVHLGAEVPVENHARNGDDESERGVVQRHRNAVRELYGIGGRRGLRAEDLDH